jgi:hypothetical protein
VNARVFQTINFGFLIILAAAVVALLAGLPVPRFAVALIIGAQAIFRSYVTLRFGNDASRRRLPFNLLISLVFVYLIMSSAGGPN